MISSSENRIIYNGNGAATEFGYPFKILEKTECITGAGHVDLYDRVDLIPFGKLNDFFTKELI